MFPPIARSRGGISCKAYESALPRRMPRKPIPLRCFARLTAFSLLLSACAPADVSNNPEKAGLVPAAPARSFAVMGDTPYSETEARRLDSLINAVNGEKLAFMVHVGDITS